MSVSTATSVGLLGRLPVRHDVRTLALARYVSRSRLPRAPASLDLARRVPEWPMYANDRLGDCTCAAAGHMIEAWTAAAGRFVEVSEQAVIVAFEHVKVVDPLTGEEGAVELDVLKFWRKTGIARHRIGAFASVPVHDKKLVRTATYLFGGLYIGLALPQTAQDQAVWDWTGSLTGPARPGSWGGHAVDVVGYSEDGLDVVTWSEVKTMTWAFWRRYCDEAYCVLSPDFLAAGKAPNGFDLAALKADLELVTT
jgi:hypothetical protein